MEQRRTHLSLVRAVLSRMPLLSLLFVSACGGSSDPDLDILNPNSKQYGKSYPEWAAEWVAYLRRVAPPDCADPLVDASGASCGLYQDPESAAFFLTGTSAGVAVREQCRVPHGKALFFPLIASFHDNAGVAADSLVADDELAARSHAAFDRIVQGSLRLHVDGHGIGGLARGALAAAPYTLTIPDEANSFSCAGLNGVTGEFAGYLSGYWAMLPALTRGTHSVAFTSAMLDETGATAVDMDVRYELEVE